MRVYLFGLFCFLTGVLAVAKPLQDCNLEDYKAMVTCSQNNTLLSDQKLNQVYEKVLATYAHDKDFIKRLNKEQAAWQMFFNLHLQTYYPMARKPKPSAWSLCRASKSTELTQQRIAQLEALLDRDQTDVCEAFIAEK